MLTSFTLTPQHSQALGPAYAGRGRGEHDKCLRVRRGGGVFKPGEYILVSTVYFPFLKIFSIKKKNENDQGNGGFIDVTWFH